MGQESGATPPLANPRDADVHESRAASGVSAAGKSLVHGSDGENAGGFITATREVSREGLTGGMGERARPGQRDPGGLRDVLRCGTVRRGIDRHHAPTLMRVER